MQKGSFMQATRPITAPANTDPDQLKIKRICFVCTGNTCRSPMAAAVANAMAQEQIARLPSSIRDLATPEWLAFSAGLFAKEGDPIAPNAIHALEEAEISVTEGLDYHNHTAHTLTDDEADKFDLLIGLTREHAIGLMIRFPHLAQKITFFPQDISDPYGGSPALYRSCLEQIRLGVASLLPIGEPS